MAHSDPDPADLEQLLARAAARGDRTAAATLFQRHHRAVFACCVRLTGDPEAAADLTQEVFLRMLRQAGSFRGEARFSTWLLRVARNAAIDWRRARATRLKGEEQMAVESAVHRPRPEEALERADLLQRALDRLRPESREALVLARYHDLPHRELATVLECTEAAARVRVHRAMRELREIVLAMEGGVP